MTIALVLQTALKKFPLTGSAPAPPSGPLVITVTATTADLVFTPSVTGGAVHRLEIYQDGVLVRTERMGNSGSHTVSGLVPDTDYEFRIRAGNYWGDSGYGTPTSRTAHTNPPTVPTPNAPSNLSNTVLSDTAFTVTLQDNSTDETSFRVQASTDPAFGTVAAELTGAANQVAYAFSGLTQATDYYVRARAENSVGQSAWSASLPIRTLVTPPLTPPAAPSAPTVSVLSSSSLRINYTDNSNNEAGFYAEISTSATLAGNGSFATILQAASGTVNATSIPFTGLNPSTLYRLHVRAFNASNSAFTSVVPGTTSASTGNLNGPPKPTGLSANVISSTRVDLSWTAGSGTESEFVVEVSEAGPTGTVWREACRSDTTSYSYRRATPGTSMRFRVRGRSMSPSGGGISLASDPVAAVTPATTPGSAPLAPYNVRGLGHSGTEVFLDWRMASAGTEAQFDVQKSPAGQNSWSTVNVGGSGNSFAPANFTFARVTALTASTSYDFRVRATNAAGSSAWVTVSSVSTLAAGAVWSPTGRNPRVLLSPRWKANWLSAKADYDANPANPATYAGKWYGAFLTGANSIKNGTAPSYAVTHLQAALMYHLTGDAAYCTGAFNYLRTTQFGTLCTVTDSANATPTTIKVTGPASQAANAYANFYKTWFASGALCDPALKGFRVLSSSYAAGVTTLTFNRSLPSNPADGDTLYLWSVYQYTGNPVRDNLNEYVIDVELLWGGLTTAQRNQLLLFINCAQCDTQLADDVPAYIGGIGPGDSDQMTAGVMGCLNWSQVSAGLGNPRAASFATAISGNGGFPVGGLDATGVDITTGRNTLEVYGQHVLGGEWIESAHYNEGTATYPTQACRALYDLLGADKYPTMTRVAREFARFRLSQLNPAVSDEYEWGDKDAAWGGLWAPPYMVNGSQYWGLFGGYDDIGPLAISVMRTWWDSSSAFRSPYSRFYTQFDPTLAPADYHTRPKAFANAGPVRDVILADTSSDNGAGVLLLGMSQVGVQHMPSYLGSFLCWRKQERVMPNPEGYGYPWSAYPEGVNTAYWAGLAFPTDMSGPVAHDILADGHSYLRTSSHGDIYGGVSYYNPPATSLYEFTQQRLYVPSLTGGAAVVIDFARGYASSPRKLAGFSQYSSNANYAGTVAAAPNPAPTTTTFSGTQTNAALNAFKDYWITFTGGNLSGQFFKVSASTSSGSSGAGVTAYTVADGDGNPMPSPPSVGSTYTSRPGSHGAGNDYGPVLGAPALWQWGHHAWAQPTLNATNTAWQTTGGQFCRADHLLPVGYQRKLYDVSSFFSGPNGALTPSERKWRYVTYPATAWPADATPQFVLFLNVVSAADAANVVASERLTSTAGLAVEFAHVTRAGDPDILAGFGAEPNTPELRSGFTRAWTAVGSSTLVFLAPLDPRKTWTYVLDGGSSTPLTVPESQLGRLTVSGAGAHTLALTAS